MVPTLKKARRPAVDGALPNGHSSFEVRWVPDPDQRRRVVGSGGLPTGFGGCAPESAGPAGVHHVGADRPGQRHLRERGGPARGPGPAARPAQQGRGRRGHARPARRRGLRRSGSPGRRARPPARPVGPARLGSGQGDPRRAAGSPRRRGRMVPVGARSQRRGWPGAGRDRPGHLVQHTQQRGPGSAQATRADLPRAPATRRTPAGRSRAQPGRGVGPDDRHAARRSPRPASTCGCRRSHGASPRPSFASPPRTPPSPSSALSSWPTCAGARSSTTSSSPPRTSSAWPARPSRWCGRGANGSSWTMPTWPRPPLRWPSGPTRRS